MPFPFIKGALIPLLVWSFLAENGGRATAGCLQSKTFRDLTCFFSRRQIPCWWDPRHCGHLGSGSGQGIQGLEGHANGVTQLWWESGQHHLLSFCTSLGPNNRGAASSPRWDVRTGKPSWR